MWRVPIGQASKGMVMVGRSAKPDAAAAEFDLSTPRPVFPPQRRKRCSRRGARPSPDVQDPAAERSWPPEKLPDLSVLRRSKTSPPVFPLEVFGDRWAQW